MKELFKISMLVEGPSLGKLPKFKLPKVVTTELVALMQKGSKVLDHYMNQELLEDEKEEE
jgi:alanine dehydrogenase